MSKKLDYEAMLEKLLKSYASYNKEETGFMRKALELSKKRKIVKEALKVLKTESKEELKSEFISRAFWFAKKKHIKQKRFSGEPYFIHPYNTALYLTELKMDAPSICAALLHDVIEDTETSLEEIKLEFGKEVASLVESLTKLKHIVSMSRRKGNNITLQQILLATTKDIRVILIKLADKYHNLQTLEFLPKEKQISIASTALEFYVPLAKKLGMHELKDAFEEICFKIVKPKIFSKIGKKIKEKRNLKETEMDLMIKKLEEKVGQANLNVSFRKYRRTKYAVFKKMTQNLKSFHEIQDFVVLVALTDTREECYEFLGLLHNTFSPVPMKFRDHMTISQLSLYKSIHTTVIGPKHTPIKVYIRTKEMDRHVRRGAAELLMQSKTDKKVFEKNVSFLSDLTSIDFEDLPTESFIEFLKTDYLQDRIFVFTKAGKLIELPRDASVIDFAYVFDETIAGKAKKARVNGKLVPLWHKLKNGDLVEVVFGKTNQVSKLWQSFAISVKARKEIQKHLKGKKIRERMPLVNLRFRAVDRVGLVKDFAQEFAKVNANIFSAEITTSADHVIGRNSFTLEIDSPESLEKLLKKLRKIKGIIDIKSNYIE